MLTNSYPPGEGERVLPYGGRMAVKPFDELRTGVGVQGRKGDKLLDLDFRSF
jgi:hypothetical protein